jgi:CO dehydrogenase/acetyl-CoA synthase epsilon subunit
MGMFKRKKPVDNRALIAFNELMQVTGRVAACIGRAGQKLLTVGPHVKDPAAIEALTQAHRELRDANEDQRAVVEKVVQMLGVPGNGSK